MEAKRFPVRGGVSSASVEPVSHRADLLLLLVSFLLKKLLENGFEDVLILSLSIVRLLKKS